MHRERDVPVKEGEEYKVEIEAVGEKGDGIAKVEGFVLFVANVKKGDYVKVRVTKVLKNVGFAEVIERLEKPAKEKKFAEVRPAELEAEEPEPKQKYEDTENFGEGLEEE